MDDQDAVRAPAGRDLEVLAFVTQRGKCGPAVDQLRANAIAANLGLVGMVAGRFAHFPVERADLMQVGAIGLMTAIDRFEPRVGAAFATFAIPHISGQIRHYLRDEIPMVQVPRRIRENASRTREMREVLAARLQRQPSVLELARATSLSISDVVEALESNHAIHPASWDELDAPTTSPTCELDLVETRETLRVMLHHLAPRPRAVIILYFWREMTQAQIATELGIAQISVSRILASSLTQLRRMAA